MGHNWKSWLLAGVVVMLAGVVALPVTAQKLPKAGGQSTFATPEKAVQALVAAVRDDANAKLLAILGPEAAELISSGDPIADRNGRNKFLTAYTAQNSLKNQQERQVVLQIGTDDYPFPIPLVKGDKGWFFDTPAGKEEILNRRIGRNELSTITVLHAYIGAQREYACRSRHDSDMAQFAQQLISSAGQHNGLYWPVAEGEKESPLGPLIAQATEAGYDEKLVGGEAEPFHGYYFKILTAQGPHATGGAFDYLVNDKMVLGFGLVAYPARYGSTGVKTFMVNQAGEIHEKDLGEKTAAAAAMTTYDPDETWQRTKEE